MNDLFFYTLWKKHHLHSKLVMDTFIVMLVFSYLALLNKKLEHDFKSPFLDMFIYYNILPISRYS